MQEIQTSAYTDVLPQKQSFSQVLTSYFQLTKPRIILLLLITTAGGTWIAADGQVDAKLLLMTMIGGALASGSANTINCIYDQDIDYIMERTRHRPLPSGRIQPRHAVIFAVSLAAISFLLLTTFANLLCASLAMAGILTYVLVYTHLLKRHSTQNIVIGGAAGAIPPLVGWAAVTGDLSWTAWTLFAIICLWTPPHFWALAIMIKEDYAKVGVPMLPVVEGEETTARQIFYYTLALVASSFLLVYPLQVMTPVYGAIALLLGILFIRKAWKLMQTPTDLTEARSVFKFSILYLMLLCAGMAIDYFPMVRSVFH
ncbi:MAG: heme o synthase [Oculatellaceae cyanobacterium Prado106]|nr:heme o synthase [Oculatellaceae cyanobacterium Prado106]